MEQMTRDHFLMASSADRTSLCAELGDKLTQRLREAQDFHGEVRRVVDELRNAGFDLWSFDHADEFEVWCPNYHTPSGPGLIITFSVKESVKVEWTNE